MKVLAIIAARMDSQRFPGKVMADLNGRPVIWWAYTRTALAVPNYHKGNLTANTVVAIPATKENDALAAYLKEINVPSFRWDGPEDDVLGRYAACARQYDPDLIVRVTGDCPLVDPVAIRGLVCKQERTGAMYVSNVYPERTVPSGFDVEVFTATALYVANALATTAYDREHVTPWMKREFTRNVDWKSQLSLDTEGDLARIRSCLGAL